MASTTHDDRLGRLRDGADWLARGFERRVQVDLRALAAFRIAIGALIVLDLLLRARDFTAFYTNDGVLPTAALYSDYTDVYSLHAHFGDAWIVGLLFAVAAVFAVLLMLGYRTRTVTIVSWLLIFSLHNRNPMILNGGDVLFRMLLFWGIFLPLGERWSIDARRRDLDRDRTATATMATAAILAQVAIMYVSNFVHKTRGEEWLDGEAVAYIMTLDQFTVLLGPYLAEFPQLLRAFTYFWLFLMAMAPFLFLLTGWPRALLATGFMGMHIGMALTMQISVFPLVAVAGLLLFYQSVVWDTAQRVARQWGVIDRLRALERRLEDAWPSPSFGGRPRIPYPDEVPGARLTLTTLVPTVFVVLILVSNAHALGYSDPPPDRGQELLDKTDTDQSWQLFAPNPLRDTRWFVANGTLENGEHADPLNGGEVTYDRPPNVADRVGSARWRKYLSNVYGTEFGGNDNHQAYLANYLCGTWNSSHDTQMESVEIYALREQGTPFGGEEEVRQMRLIGYDCSGELVQP